MDVSHGVGTTSLEFRSDELLFVGGDYGQIILEGSSEASRRAIDTIVGAARLRAGIKHFRLGVTLDDSPPLVVEDRHAGLERSTYFDHRDRDSDDDPERPAGQEGMVENATGEGSVESGPR